jgi:hypothetical protein
MVEAVQALRGHIRAKSQNDTFVMSFDGDSPDMVFAVMNHLMGRLEEENGRLRGARTVSTRQFLAGEKRQAEQELESHEQALAAFLASHPEFAQDSRTQDNRALAAGASVRAAERERVRTPANPQEQTLLALTRQADRLSRELRSPGEPATAPSVSLKPTSDPEYEAALAQASGELNSAQRELSDRRSMFTEQHPDVIAASQKVHQAAAKLLRVRSREPAATQPLPEFNPAQPMGAERRAALEAEMARVQAQIALSRAGRSGTLRNASAETSEGNRIVALETEWSSLNRSVADARDRHGQLQEKLFAATMLASAEVTGHANQLVVLDAPYRPTRPSKHGPRTTSAVVLVAVLMSGFSLAVLRVLMDVKVHDEFDLTRLDFCRLGHVVPKGAFPSEKRS